MKSEIFQSPISLIINSSQGSAKPQDTDFFSSVKQDKQYNPRHISSKLASQSRYVSKWVTFFVICVTLFLSGIELVSHGLLERRSALPTPCESSHRAVRECGCSYDHHQVTIRKHINAHGLFPGFF